MEVEKRLEEPDDVQDGKHEGGREKIPLLFGRNKSFPETSILELLELADLPSLQTAEYPTVFQA